MKASIGAFRIPDEPGVAPSPGLCCVRDVMSRKVIAVQPDLSLVTAAELMLENEIGGLPVVDESGRAVGVVSKTDVVRETTGHDIPTDPGPLPEGLHTVDGTTVREVMSTRLITISEDASISAAAELLTGTGVHRLPVLSSDGRVVGLISATDIVRWVAGLPS